MDRSVRLFELRHRCSDGTFDVTTNLRSLDLRAVYDSADCSLVDDLLVPLLRHSQDYVRGVGYFTSGWLRVASKGLVRLVENGGRARIITSPHLTQEDVNAIATGAEARADELVRERLLASVDDLARTLEADTLAALAWLVADGLLEFRIAVPRPKFAGADYHDKVAVFADSVGDRVAIHGSFNDSVKGTLNGEAFSVFRSWTPSTVGCVDAHEARLRLLWEGGNQQFRSLPLPDAVRERVIALRDTRPRPYAKPVGEWSDAPPALRGTPEGITLHPHQHEAVEAWLDAGCRGIFEMATGTGKTFAALAALSNRSKHLDGIAAIIVVPFEHLVSQWMEQCMLFGLSPIPCSGSHVGWYDAARPAAQHFSLQPSHSICLVAVQNTAASDRFQRATNPLPEARTMLIADEVHYLGSARFRQALLPNVALRLGLSATPRRWFDNEGTQVVLDYFGGVCYELPLRDAIGSFLTKYDYDPMPVSLSEEESEEYARLSATIQAMMSGLDSKGGVPDDLKTLLIKRARIVARAEAKVPRLLDALQRTRAEGWPLSHTLIYCAPGTHREVLRVVADQGLRCHEFVHTVGADQRQEVLARFEEGEVEVLVAIKCLDEGVDVPATRQAYVLASTTNPREFVQRRGRILRRAPGKSKAIIHDLVVVPSEEQLARKDPVGGSLLRREMPRFAEFCRDAENQYSAKSIVRPLLDIYEMTDWLDMDPWQVHAEAMAGDNDEFVTQEDL